MKKAFKRVQMPSGECKQTAVVPASKVEYT